MKITILQNYDNSFKEVGDITSRINEEYAQKYGYTYQLYRERHPVVTQHGIYIVMDKILFLRDYLIVNPDIEFVLYMDADSFVTNFTKRVEDIIDVNYNLLIGNDIHGINTGVFLIKNCQWSINLLNRIWDMRFDFPNRNELEQSALKKYIQENPNDPIKIISQKTLNSYDYCFYGYPSNTEGNWEIGDYIFHSPGMHNHDRIKIFNRLIPLIIK